MPQDHELDQLLINGNTAWGTIPGGLLTGVPDPTPIHLYRGNTKWGYDHIIHRHSRNNLFKFATTIEGTIWDRLCQPGQIHDTEETDRLTITVSLAPSAFVVLHHLEQHNCFSIITMYSKREPTTRALLGDYIGSQKTAGRDIFGWHHYST